jgi:16S rRNA (uracil1498-N3)-methyltransferase
MPGSRLPCVNPGGTGSLIRLDRKPVLEEAMALPPEAVRALSFWAARPGEIITLLDPEGVKSYRARITSLSPPDVAVVVPFEEQPGPPEGRVHLTVYQALPRKERFELVLQKLTELGVGRIVPFTCSHSTTLLERDAGQKKSHRWPEVVRRAAKQCRRAMLPELAPVLNWQEALTEAATAGLGMMLFEGPCDHSVGGAMMQSKARRIALLVGPEGGFSSLEVQEALEQGIVPVSIGRHILRTETAAIVGTAIIQFCLGELG